MSSMGKLKDELSRTNRIIFEIDVDCRHVKASGCSELEGLQGYMIGEGMALFNSENFDLFMVNTKIGIFRKLSSEFGVLQVEDNDIDYDIIKIKCTHGYNNALNKIQRYGRLSRWDDFHNGICAISWTLYPEGGYFADEDGFGIENNDEEVVYGIINTSLKFIEPFRPIQNIRAYLEELRTKYKQINNV